MFINFDGTLKKNTKKYLRDFLYINLGIIKFYINVNFKCSNLHETEKIAKIIIKTFTAPAISVVAGAPLVSPAKA